MIDGENIRAEERSLEDITVTYKQASSFFVTIPKTIVLDGWKQAAYSVKVSGDIGSDQCVYVAPLDGIEKTESIDFYMKDQATEDKKEDVVATVTHNKFHWNSAEVAEGYKETDNLVSAPDLTAGIWKGIFQIEIKLESHISHIHDYIEEITKEPTCTEAGEKTYTCDCGDSYTEVIPAKGHHFADGVCTGCGEKDPDYHEHSYDEGVVTKEPTCTEEGEKTFTCDCGDSYTEKIPMTEHSYGDDDKCTNCGKINPNHAHSYDEGVVTKEPTCTEKGEKTYTCSECGHIYIEDIGAMGHDYVQRSIWENTSNGDYAFVQDGTKWTSNNKGVKSTTATSTWTISLNEDKEYSFKYKVSSEDRYDKLTIKLDDEIIANAISGAGEEITYTNTLTAGTHTLTATYTKDTSTDKNDDCGYLILEDLYKELVEITKEPTCTENGERVYTCVRCGKTYSEIIPAIGHNYEDNKCTNCGEVDPSHVHSYEPYIFTIKPEIVSSTKVSSLPSYISQYRVWSEGSAQDQDQYYVYGCYGIHVGGNTGTHLRVVFNIDMPEDYVGTYDYPYYYNCNKIIYDTGAAVRLLINNKLVYRHISKATSNDVYGVNNEVNTMSLSAGKNSFTVDYHIYNDASNTTLNENLQSSALLYLHKTALFDGSEYHICNECGEREAHHFVDEVCIECGWHEGDHTHHYVDGFCDKCGKDETQYTLRIDSPSFLSEVEGISSSTQYIRNGDVFELPEKTNDSFDLNGYSIVKAVKNIQLCSSNLLGEGAISVWDNGTRRVQAPLTFLDEFGLEVAEITENKPWEGTSVPTEYYWKQTAVSDTIVIEKPSLYVFTVNEHEKCDNIYDAAQQVGGTLTFQDITNNKSYNLKWLVSSTQKTYDYDNVKIRCISKTVSNTSGTGSYDRKYYKTYMIFLDPGEYKLLVSGEAGNGYPQDANSVYSVSIGSPIASTSVLAAPVINNVKHYASGGTLYELIPIENGQEFDYSTMYTNETKTDIYLISNWTAKTTE